MTCLIFKSLTVVSTRDTEGKHTTQKGHNRSVCNPGPLHSLLTSPLPSALARMHVCVCVCVCVHLCVRVLSRSVASDSLRPPWTVAHQDPLSMGFFRQEYWSALPFPPSGYLPDPGIEPTSLVSCIGRQLLYH